MASYHEMFVRIATGDLPPAAAAALALSKLTPLRKPAGGVRPTAAPAILRRLAGRALLGKHKKALERDVRAAVLLFALTP